MIKTIFARTGLSSDLARLSWWLCVFARGSFSFTHAAIGTFPCRVQERTSTRAPLILTLLIVFLEIDFQHGVRRPAAVAQPATVATGSPALAANQERAEPPVDKPEEEPHAVIPPGQEQLLADMLGLGATLAGDCKFAGGQVDGRAIRSTYTCHSGEVVFQLVHPSDATAAATETERFAITVESGSPPAGLVDALASRIRSREGAFEWKWLGQPRSRFSPRMILLAAVGLLLILVVGGVLRVRSTRGTRRL